MAGLQQITLVSSPVVGLTYSWGAAIYRLVDLVGQADGWQGIFENLADDGDRFTADIRPYVDPAPAEETGHLAELAGLILELEPADPRWQQAAAEYIAAKERERRELATTTNQSDSQPQTDSGADGTKQPKGAQDNAIYD